MDPAAPFRASVIIPTYNSARFLPETLNSIRAQSCREAETIVVDDGSTDDTAEVVAPFASEQLRYVAEPNSGGPSRPRNVGIRSSTAPYIFVFDSDDVMMPGKLARSLALLESQPRVGLVFTNFVVMDEQGIPSSGTFLSRYHHFQSLPKERVGDGLYVVPGRPAYEGLIFENYIGISSVAVRRSVLEDVGMFDENLLNTEDLDFTLRVARSYDLGYVDIVGHRYRKRQGSMLNTLPSAKLAPNRIKLLRRELERGLSKAASRAARRRIAANYYDLGYEHRCLGQWKTARSYYLRGLRESRSWPLMKGVVRTLLGRLGP